jgi:FimV-like protein
VHRKTLEQKMSRGQNPLMLMMALSLPGAAHALGLGEIHVDSALNEPLAAEIDIVGATAEELEGLTATVASRDTFLKFGADRPAFLSTATFKVAHDARGRPVLSIRSTDSFTEPVVNLVVDLRWHNGEVIRQYSLLLDPAGFPTAIQQATAITAAAPAAPVTIPRSTLTALPASAARVTISEVPASVDTASASNTDVPASKSSRKMTHVKVGSRATLRGVAWRVGARSDVDLKKTMLAIFRANPAAFEGNINILHLGASLTIPSEEVIAAIPADEAKREIRAQMAAWRGMPNRVAKAPSAPASNGVESPVAAQPRAQPAAVAATAPTTVNYSVTAPTAAAAPAATVAPAAAAATTPTDAELKQRIQTLEQGLHDMQNQVQREHDKIVGVQAQLKYEEQAAESAPASAAPQTAVAHPSRLPAIFGGLTLLAGALAAIYWKLRRRPAPKASHPKVELTPEPFLERSADLTPTHTVAAEPVRRDAPRTPQRPIMTEDGLELSAAWNSVRDKQEAKVRAQLSAALTTAAERSQSVLTVSEEELHAAYDDTLDLSSETAILAAEIAAASDDTAMLAAATVQLSSEELQEAADAAMAETGVNETAIMDMDPSSTNSVATIKLKQAGDSEPTVEHVQFNQADDANAETMLSNPRAMSDGTKLDYNLTDLDLSNGHHVQMPSMLHEHVVVKERRTNLVDVLKMAIEREPDRSDLRMKLLETYYAAASTNRQGFLEVVQKLARERDLLGEGEWDKIAYMGKQIASDTGLFDTDVVSVEDDKLADCA